MRFIRPPKAIKTTVGAATAGIGQDVGGTHRKDLLRVRSGVCTNDAVAEIAKGEIAAQGAARKRQGVAAVIRGVQRQRTIDF